MRDMFALESHSQGRLPHPYVAHCISSIVGFAMDSQHTCTRCWRVKPMSIGMLHDVAKALAIGCQLQVHKVVISSQYQLNVYFCTHKHLAHPDMSLVGYMVGAAILSSVANQHN
jgi:hypothetical protein